MQAPATSFSPAVAKMPSTSAPVALLVASAAAPLVLFGLGRLGVGIPYARWLVPALALVTIIVVLVWIHGAFLALRGRTSFSPGMAVGGWFIPIANLFLPALILRDAWRASVGNGGGIAFLWMIAWWISTAISALEGLGLQFSSFDRGPVTLVLLGESRFAIPGLSMDAVAMIWNFTMLFDVAAYGLLALIVARIGRPRG
jgi:hypothetical protein